MFASQSGVSKQMRDLEDEIGGELFERRGKRLLGLTALGHRIVEISDRLLLEADNLKQAANQYTASDQGTLEIATTHTQARYRLPDIILRFKERCPKVRLVIRQAYTSDIPELVASGSADIGIATEAFDNAPGLMTFPFYTWQHIAVAPTDHPLTRAKTVSLADLASYPIVTYVEGLTGRRRVDEAIAAAGVSADIAMTALDADVIKTYVQLGLGLGIIAPMAFDAERDVGLSVLPLADNVPTCTTSIALRRGRLHRSYVYRFIEACAPHLTQQVIEEAETGLSPRWQEAI